MRRNAYCMYVMAWRSRVAGVNLGKLVMHIRKAHKNGCIVVKVHPMSDVDRKMQGIQITQRHAASGVEPLTKRMKMGSVR